MNEIQQYLATSGVVGIVIVVILVIWAVMTFLMPFFVFGAWRRAKQVSEKMNKIVAVLTRYEEQAQKGRAIEHAAEVRTSQQTELDELTAKLTTP
ncbi:MAG: hypothetical protein O7F71_13795 [Gammaproteobacteria bacterium]|nr:hypothetical protein [Gammaproteobacteria bacterium]